MNALLAVGMTVAFAAPAHPVRDAPRPPVAAPAARRQLPLTEEDVRRLLRDWSTFEAALATLHESVPQLPHGGASPADLEKADAAWAADARIRRALASTGTDPDQFLALYRRIAEAWWALAEREARERTAAGLRREIDALRAAKDADAEPVAAELERGLKSLEEPHAAAPDLDLVARHRAELAAIFSPEAPGP